MEQKKDKRLSLKDAKNAIINGDFDPETILKVIDTLEPVAKPITPWWVILLKVIAYAIGLIVAGYSTTAAAMTLLS